MEYPEGWLEDVSRPRQQKLRQSCQRGLPTRGPEWLGRIGRFGPIFLLFWRQSRGELDLSDGESVDLSFLGSHALQTRAT